MKKLLVTTACLLAAACSAPGWSPPWSDGSASTVTLSGSVVVDPAVAVATRVFERPALPSAAPGTLDVDGAGVVVRAALDPGEARNVVLRLGGPGLLHVRAEVISGTGVLEVTSGTRRASALVTTGDSLRLLNLRADRNVLSVVVRSLAAAEGLVVDLRAVATRGLALGPVYVGAYADPDPAFQPDPAGDPRPALAGTTTTGELEEVPGGGVAAPFRNLRVAAGRRVHLFAYADNDESAAAAPLNFARGGAPASPDVAAAVLSMETGDMDRADIVLRVSGRITDADWDGVPDHDTDGDGLPDDNCPRAPNVAQEDTDGDGVGDACDVCPDVFDPQQVNTDGAGRGDACVRVEGSQCPWWLGRRTTRCAGDTDGDGWDDYRLVCPSAAPCRPDERVRATSDTCPGTPSESQVDTDGDAVFDATGTFPATAGGDACDTDDDADGIPDEAPGLGTTADGGGGTPRCAGGQRSSCTDNCPKVPNGDQADRDGDGVGDACDLCPDVADPGQGDANGDGVGDACTPDDDGDLRCDPAVAGSAGCSGTDNCPGRANPDQRDRDGDGHGDACDVCIHQADPGQHDRDGDGAGDACDVCPWVSDPAQSDRDNDGVGDACDDDDDGDGVPDAQDACPTVRNARPACTADSQCAAQGAGECESGTCTGQPDQDGDGQGDACDNCPRVPNTEQRDTDRDGIGDACDLCPRVMDAPRACGSEAACEGAGTCNRETGRCSRQDNLDQALGTGADTLGDACDPDDDGDGIAEDGDRSGLPGDAPCTGGGQSGCDDNCPRIPNPLQADGDGDGQGDACDDPDADDDEVADPVDLCPDAADAPPACVSDATCEAAGAGTCGAGGVCTAQADADGDGYGDACDRCPMAAEPAVTCVATAVCQLLGAGRCVAGRCSAAVDRDGDGLPDACDRCPSLADSGGADTDNDGVGDACDEDDDNDGITDHEDGCPWVADPTQADSDADGVGDECDVCAGVPDARPACTGAEDCVGAGGRCLQGRCVGQRDVDGDGSGDACDADSDGDGRCDPGRAGTGCTGTDNCPHVANADQDDADGDGKGAACDVDDALVRLAETEPNTVAAPDTLPAPTTIPTLVTLDGAGGTAGPRGAVDVDVFHLLAERAGTLSIQARWTGGDAVDVAVFGATVDLAAFEAWLAADSGSRGGFLPARGLDGRVPGFGTAAGSEGVAVAVPAGQVVHVVVLHQRVDVPVVMAVTLVPAEREPTDQANVVVLPIYPSVPLVVTGRDDATGAGPLASVDRDGWRVRMPAAGSLLVHLEWSGAGNQYDVVPMVAPADLGALESTGAGALSTGGMSVYPGADSLVVDRVGAGVEVDVVVLGRAGLQAPPYELRVEWSAAAGDGGG